MTLYPRCAHTGTHRTWALRTRACASSSLVTQRWAKASHLRAAMRVRACRGVAARRGRWGVDQQGVRPCACCPAAQVGYFHQQIKGVDFVSGRGRERGSSRPSSLLSRNQQSRLCTPWDQVLEAAALSPGRHSAFAAPGALPTAYLSSCCARHLARCSWTTPRTRGLAGSTRTPTACTAITR